MNQEFQNFHLNQTSYIKIEKMPFQISLNDQLFFAGSCFSDYLYSWAQNHFLNVHQIPHGNIYNPVSLNNNLKMCFNPALFKIEDIEKNDNLYFHTSFHSKLSNNNKDIYFSQINKKLLTSQDNFKNINIYIFTLGTAFVFQRKSSGKIVNNCHKLDANQFKRKKLEINEIVQNLIEIKEMILQQNRNSKIIFSISPVRHLRDKPTENSLSKALLRCALDKIVDELNVFYFPSFELMMDELRDYRYYNQDLVHPSEVAVQYIMKRFIEITMSEDSIKIIHELEKFRSQLNHRSITPDSEKHIKFLKKIKNEFFELEKKYPFLNWPESIF